MNHKVFKLIRLVLLSILSIGFIIVILEAGAALTNVILPWHKESAIQTTLLWGGLADLPNSSRSIIIKTKGNMFTRSFTLTFILDKININQWILQSKRLKDQQPIEMGNQKVKYKIKPGEENSLGGTVDIDYKKETINIQMSWN